MFSTIQPTKEEFIRNYAKVLTETGLHSKVLYSHRLLKYRCEGELVISTLEDLSSNRKLDVVTCGLHIRTGSLSKPVRVKHPEEHVFKGKVFLGVSNDCSAEELRGKRVVVVGSGPFGFENVEKSIRNEASHTTWLCRRLKIGLSEFSN